MPITKKQILTATLAFCTAANPILTLAADFNTPTLESNVILNQSEDKTKLLYVNVKNQGGAVILNEGDSNEQTIRLEEDKRQQAISLNKDENKTQPKEMVISSYDKDGLLISQEDAEDSNFVYICEANVNEALDIKAISDEGYDISEYVIADALAEGIEEQTGFKAPEKEFSYSLVVEQDTSISVKFEKSETKTESEKENNENKNEDISIDNTNKQEISEPEKEPTKDENKNDDITIEEPIEPTPEGSVKPDKENAVESEKQPEIDVPSETPETDTSIENVENPELNLNQNSEENKETESQNNEDLSITTPNETVIPNEGLEIEAPNNNDNNNETNNDIIIEPNLETNPNKEDSKSDFNTEDKTTDGTLINDSIAIPMEVPNSKNEIFLIDSMEKASLNKDNFASARLVVMAKDKKDIVDPENIIGEYGQIYLLQYKTVDESMNAYLYYSQNAIAVEPDSIMTAATEADVSVALSDIIVNNETNPISTLAVENNQSILQPTTDKIIALIDTGVTDGPNIIDRVSLIDDVLEGNGHGNEMVNAIVSMNPNAKILSIRAMGNDGKGTVSSIVSAMEYAMKQNVSIINLSMYSKANLSNSVIETEIQKAVDMGITVVGAAGNDGADAMEYMPGSVLPAWIIGAADEFGMTLSGSNFGTSVDYNVIASTTSEAAAKFSGYVSLNGIDNIKVNEDQIFSTNYVYTEPTPSITIPGESRPPHQVPPEYEETGPAYDEEEIWNEPGYPDYSAINERNEVVWVKDTEFDFKNYNPYGNNKASVVCKTDTSNIVFDVNNTYLVEYEYTLKQPTGYFWTDKINYTFTDDRTLATVQSSGSGKLMPEYVNQDRNQGYNGIVPSKAGETVEGKEYTVFTNTPNFELEGLLLDYNPNTFKLNNITDKGGFDITKPGTYTVVMEISHFMYYDYPWFIKNTVHVVDPSTLEPGVYFNTSESTLMINRITDGLYGGYGDLYHVTPENNEYIISCIDTEYELAVKSSDPETLPETACVITKETNGTRLVTIQLPNEPLTKPVILTINRPNYHAPKLHASGGWQPSPLTEAELNQFTPEQFAQYEDELSGEADTNEYMNIAATWTTIKSKTFLGNLHSGWKTGRNYSGGKPIENCTNYGTCEASKKRKEISDWITKNGYTIDESKIRDFSVACTSGHDYWGMKVNYNYQCYIKASIQACGKEKRVLISCLFCPGGGYQTFYGCYPITAKNNGFIKIKKMFRNSTIANATDRIESLHTVFDIYTDEACTQKFTSLALENSSEGGYKASGTVEVTPDTYWVVENYTIKGCATNKYEHYGPIVVKPNQTVDIGEYCKEHGMDTEWENMEKGWVYNRPFYYRGKILSKVDANTNGPVQGAVYKMEYSEYYSKKNGVPFTPKYTWYFETDANGEFAYDDEHLAAGYTQSPMIRRRDDAPALPIGYLRIQEVKSPPGYKLDPQQFIVTVKRKDVADFVAILSRDTVHKEEPDDSVPAWKVAVNAKKVKKTLEGLAGAEFRVYFDEACSEIAGIITSGPDGMTDTLVVELSDKYPEEVTLYCKETAAPQGYIPVSDTFKLTFYKKDFDALNPGYDPNNPPADVKYETKQFGPPEGIVNEEGQVTPTPEITKPITPAPPSGSGVYVKKTSAADPDVKDLESYSLEGAEFEIYGTYKVFKSDGTYTTEEFRATMVTDKNGISNSVTLPDNGWKKYFPPVPDEQGNIIKPEEYVPQSVETTYFIKEIKPPKGHKPYVGEQKISVTMPRDKDKTFEVVFEDEPKFTKSKVEIEKFGVKGNKIEGVVYQVEYFDSNGPDESKLKKTWYLETDAQGKLLMDEAHVSKRLNFQSDPFFMHKGQIVLPIDGYLQFTEVAAPAAYKVKEEPFGFETGENASFYKKVYNDLEHCQVRIQKYKEDGSTPLEGVEFELKFLEAKYKITPDKNQYFKRLLDEGESTILSTDSKGQLAFDRLDHGRYQLTEVKTYPEYALVTKPIEFNIPMEMTTEEAGEYGNVNFDTAKQDTSYTDKWFFFDCLFEYTNNGTLKLPTTGSSGFFKYTIMGIGISGTVCAVILTTDYINKKKKRTHKHKNKK